jgi:hypothetical protein
MSETATFSLSELMTRRPRCPVAPVTAIMMLVLSMIPRHTRFGDRLHPVERQSDAQSLIGEQLLDSHFKACS